MKNLKMKSARAALDMSQQELADKVGVSRQTINAIEKGDYNPTINLCRTICKLLGKTLDELFWEEEELKQVLLFHENTEQMQILRCILRTPGICIFLWRNTAKCGTLI